MATWANFYPGLGLYDEKFKSTVSAPLAVSKDLVGCGGNTHTTSGYAGNFNSRIGCGSIDNLFTFSQKNIVANTTQVSGVTGDHVYGQARLLAYLDTFDTSIQATALTPGGPNPLLAPNTALGFGTPAKLTGNNWVFTSAAGDTRTYSVPRFMSVKGCEGVIIGYRVSQSFSENSFDPITCTPLLKYASSLSYTKILRNARTGVANNFFAGSLNSVFTGLNDSAPVTANGALSGIDAITLPETAAVLWSALGLGGTQYTVGTFA